MGLLHEPAVRVFYRDQDQDIDAVPYWEVGFCVDDRRTTITNDEPWRCEVLIGSGTDTLVLELNAELTVISTNGQEKTGKRDTFSHI